MSKPYLLLLILLTIMVISGCVETRSSPDVTAPNLTVNYTNATVNHTNIKVNITATHTPRIVATDTLQLFVTDYENSTVYVEIKGSEFRPSEMRIIKGTTVKWTNMDDARYIINGTDFVSPPLNRKESWSHHFNKTGTFEYSCPDHSWMQHGYIIVE